jgi:hypothetical protein
MTGGLNGGIRLRSKLVEQENDAEARDHGVPGAEVGSKQRVYVQFVF